MVHESDKGRVEAAGVSASEVGVLIGWIGLDALFAEGGDGVVEGLDAVAHGCGNGDVALGGEEGVVGVVGGVEEVLMVEFAKDEDHEDVAGGHGILRMGGEDGLEAGEGPFIIQDVEVLEAFVDDGVEVKRIGVEGVGFGLRLQGRGEQDGQKNEDCKEKNKGGALQSESESESDAASGHEFLALGDRRLKVRLEVLMVLLSKYTVASVWMAGFS